MNKKWSEEEKKVLKKYYKRKSKKKLMELLPDRSWAAINQYAQKLNIKRSYDIVRTTNVKKLLKETPQAYYWMGFLMADGHFTEKRIIVGLSIKDVDHIKNFAKFISANYSEDINSQYGKCCVAAANSDIVPLLRKKFKIENNKTHHPCDIKWIKNDDLLLSLIIGFIDGDGSIRKQNGRKDNQMTIKCHSSWLFNLQFISDTICKYCDLKPNIARINKYGYAEVNFTNSIILKFLKAKGRELKLPILKRKWDKVDENYISKFEEYKYILEEVKTLVQEGLSKYYISKVVNRSPASIYQMVKKHNIRKI